jgi:hypothetical protein
MAEGNDDLGNILRNTSMNIGGEMRTMFDWLNLDFDQLFPSNLTPEQKREAMKAYQQTIDALYQAAISGDFDLNNIAESVKKVIQ